MYRVYLLLGSNLGNRLQLLEQARELISDKVGKIEKASAVYESEAWGVEDQPAFVNQVLEVETVLSPEALLATNQQIEKALGRERKERWGARLMDIDILFYDDLIIETDDLKIPHPELQNRRFTLVPLAEIAPEFLHPVFGKTIYELLENCPDTLGVEKLGNF